MRRTEVQPTLSRRAISDLLRQERLNLRTLSVPLSADLACIIRERHASDDFACHNIAEEDDGGVKLLCGPWGQALQAHTIKAATIFGRGFPSCSVG
jgi:hypothetical protein